MAFYGIINYMEKCLNPKQELFCQFYINNKESFGNATLSYALAYDLDADLKGSDGQKASYWLANKASNKLLSNPRVRSRVTQLLNDLMTDEIVDSELSKVIQQDGDLSSKVSAIREYNKLKKRITEKYEHEHNFLTPFIKSIQKEDGEQNSPAITGRE